MAPTAVMLSYRLGGDDGVAVEARKWAWALGELGFSVRSVAGEIGPGAGGDDGTVLPGLAIEPRGAPPPTAADVAAALDGADLVVAENLCSLPLNVAAARAAAAALGAHRGRVVLRHHDLAWQRRSLRHLEGEFPPRHAGALHATINLRSRRELLARGFEHVVTIPNHFDLDAPPGDRAATRAVLGFADDELVLYQPARAIERKNVPGGFAFAGQLARLLPERALRYWLTGPAEDGYQPTLDRLLERAPVAVHLGRAPSLADGYAASDVVMLPSTWEGFGNPTVESVWARRPLAVYPYPVLGEISACGLQFFPLDRPEALARFLRAPDETFFDLNLRRARLSFSLDALPAAIDAAFAAMGWTAW
jgi:hypothetical protein